MAAEHNHEHQAVEQTCLAEDILDVAGRLCALLLLCGFEGYTIAPGGDRDESYTSGFVPLDDLGKAPADPSRELLTSALSTKLFEAAGERRFVPRHRQIAEFLAGRYLAKLIRGGLPARRVVALMAGTSDGRVVTALRGLSAWLAAHPGEGRRQLIDADPVGVGLYGDLGGFSTEDRECLLRSLAEFAARGPLFGHAWQDGRADGYREDTAWAFRSLASADMVESIRNLLHSPTGETHRNRTAAFVSGVLAEAEESEKPSLAALTPDLMTILRDADRPSWVTTRALNAYIHIAAPDDQATGALTAVLDAIHDGTLADPDDELRGTLLEHLYPHRLSPADVWRYLRSRNSIELVGRYWRFWTHSLLGQSTDRHTAELLDALSEDLERLVPTLHHSHFGDLPYQLLERGLKASGETLETEHLLDWLTTTGRMQGAPMRAEPARFVRRWLESRPQIQKAVFLVWLRRQVTQEPDRPHRYWSCDALHRSELPGDFGLWCLDQATALEDSEPALAQELLSQAYMAVADPSIGEGLTLAVVRERAGKGVLARHLDALHDRSSTSRAEDNEGHRELDELSEQRREAQRQRQQDWAKKLRSELDDLRNNRFFAPNLHTLAQVYLGIVADADQATSPRRRLRDFIGGDEILVDAVMAAIRGAVMRDDVPEVDETVALQSESKHSWLAYPVLASLHLLDEEDPDGLDRIDDDRKRSALAIRYCVPSGDTAQPWHERWFRQEPELVLEVLFRCAVPAVRSGEEFVPCLNALDSFTGHDDSVPALAFNESTGQFEARTPAPRFGGRDDRVHEVRLRLLEAFPTRSSNRQLPVLDRLLTKALDHPDKAALLALAQRKQASKSMPVAQRVRWWVTDSLIVQGTRLKQLKADLAESEIRVRHLAEFLRYVWDRHGSRGSILATIRDPSTLSEMIEILGRWCSAPQYASGFVTLEMDMSDLISKLIGQLGSEPGDEAQQALAGLAQQPELEGWHPHLKWAQEEQSVIHRDASYSHPAIDQVQDTLNDGSPADAADLRALLEDRLKDICEYLRGGNSDFWRQFWNEDPHRRLTGAKPEDSCRDALLANLQLRLPEEVDAVREGSYAADTRADIRANCRRFNVPIEIKKDSHPDLWRAMRDQLMAKYTTDPATDGYGIYLVLWFADAKKPVTRNPDGIRPSAPEELRQRLEQDLTAEEARKISVIVMDVTKPGEPPG